jgi:hypothetical protein
VVFVLYLILSGGFWVFGWVGGDDCWCVSFFDRLFSYPFLSLFFYFYDKINEKRRGLYFVGEVFQAYGFLFFPAVDAGSVLLLTISFLLDLGMLL